MFCITVIFPSVCIADSVHNLFPHAERYEKSAGIYSYTYADWVYTSIPAYVATVQNMLLTLGAHTQRGLRYLFCTYVVTTFPETTRNGNNSK